MSITLSFTHSAPTTLTSLLFFEHLSMLPTGYSKRMVPWVWHALSSRICRTTSLTSWKSFFKCHCLNKAHPLKSPPWPPFKKLQRMSPLSPHFRFTWFWSTFCFIILLTNMIYVCYLFVYYLLTIPPPPPENVNSMKTQIFVSSWVDPKHLTHGTWNFLIKICWVHEIYHF